mmetsp:Transcript_30222/g.68654  ORF Transcript_30222/g.68654 Transcript_30222/m.68654 type:complete len:213 (-) Transcript_30222:271-909(-)
MARAGALPVLYRVGVGAEEPHEQIRLSDGGPAAAHDHGWVFAQPTHALRRGYLPTPRLLGLHGHSDLHDCVELQEGGEGMRRAQAETVCFLPAQAEEAESPPAARVAPHHVVLPDRVAACGGRRPRPQLHIRSIRGGQHLRKGDLLHGGGGVAHAAAVRVPPHGSQQDQRSERGRLHDLWLVRQGLCYDESRQQLQPQLQPRPQLPPRQQPP